MPHARVAPRTHCNPPGAGVGAAGRPSSPHAPRSTSMAHALRRPTRTADCPTSRNGASCPGKRQCASFVLVGEGATPDRCALHPFCPGVLLPIGCSTPHRVHFCPGAQPLVALCFPSGAVLSRCTASHRALCPPSGTLPLVGALPPPSGALLSGCSASHRARCPLSGSPLPIRCTTPVHPAETTSRGSGDRARHTPWLA